MKESVSVRALFQVSSAIRLLRQGGGGEAQTQLGLIASFGLLSLPYLFSSQSAAEVPRFETTLGIGYFLSEVLGIALCTLRLRRLGFRSLGDTIFLLFPSCWIQAWVLGAGAYLVAWFSGGLLLVRIGTPAVTELLFGTARTSALDVAVVLFIVWVRWILIARAARQARDFPGSEA